MRSQPLVPDTFVVPASLVTTRFCLEPLSIGHNMADHTAWTTSLQHIQQTPGFAGRSWPAAPETLTVNGEHLAKHQRDSTDRTGFTYAALDADTGDYIGCVYFYPPRSAEFDVDVRSWVRVEQADLDALLYDAVRTWLQHAWPWTTPDYARR